MKHKKSLSALLAAVMILGSASNSVFPVSANDSDSSIQQSAETASGDELTNNTIENNGEASSTDSEEISNTESEETITSENDSTENAADVGSLETEKSSEADGQENAESETDKKDSDDISSYAVQASDGTSEVASDALDMTADIRKRTEWTDKTNGDGQITLQYKSNSGEIEKLKKMNVVLVQDKSGSMDSNYGYNLEVARKKWGTPTKTEKYPIRAFSTDGKNTAWTEGMDTIKGKGQSNYLEYLNKTITGTTYTGFRSGYFTNGEMAYNSPCQADDHFYLTVADDTISNIPAWTMVSGQYLYNISNTDLHHYKKINADDRTEWLNKGYRVIRMNAGQCWEYKNGTMQKTTLTNDNMMFFVDLSQLVQYDGNWILSTCGDDECKGHDRLSKSQEFLTNIVDYIQNSNSGSEIAYVPFWGDVPNNGTWENASGDNDGTTLAPDTLEGRITNFSGVTKLDFTTSYDTIKNQIANSFTYDGTNWTRAFKNTLDYLNGKDKENNLVIFLTDGMPQGTAGKQADLHNPYINGDEEITYNGKTQSVINHLKEAATVYACGVCINKADNSGVTERMTMVDSDKTPAYADTLDQFDKLQETILERLEKRYKDKINGKEAFYKDTIQEPFELDLEKLQKNTTEWLKWGILDTEDTATIYGVPKNVYDKATEKGIKYVYVKSTKTVYWYIGAMQTGGYDDNEHTVSFPIKYADYEKTTSGKDLALTSNTEQKLTYITTQDENTVREKTMDSPQIIFNRKEPTITVEKNVKGTTFSKNMQYRFVYSKTKQESGTIKNPVGEVTVTVKKGSTTGSAVISDVKPGTYYFYEVDKDNTMISSEVQEVTVSENAEITTEKASNSVPESATSSENETLDNRNNVLRITGDSGNVSFTNEYVDISVKKVWDDQNYADRPKEVTVRLLRNNEEIKSMILSADNNWEGKFENLEKKDASGKDYSYKIKEDEVIGYESKVEQSKDDQNAYTITNKLILGNVKIHKLDSDGKTPLEGVTFELRDSADKVVSTKTSGSDGEVLFENIVPGKYTITETKTVPGHTLLKEPIELTIPMELTKDEIDKMGVEEGKYVSYPESGKYFIYDFTYEVTNHATFQPPFTGGKIPLGMYISLIAGMLLLGGIVIEMFHKKRKSH